VDIAGAKKAAQSEDPNIAVSNYMDLHFDV
jgi:hypothetical protein